MKKKFYYAGMLAAGLLTFASCNNDDDPIIEQNPVQTEEDAQVIRIAVANAGDGLTTKAGRPLLSSEAKQTIDKVKVVIVNTEASNSVVAIKVYDNWMSESELYTDDGHGQEAIWKLSGDEKLGQGKYRVYAIGYHSTSDYTDWSTWEGLVKQSLLNPVSLTIGNGELGEEVFAGEIAAINVNADGEFEAPAGSTLVEGEENDFNVLTLHRQVAGTMGYFTSIPTNAVGGTSVAIENLQLRLVARDLNNAIIFDEFNSEFRETGSDVQYVVNGFKSSTTTPTEHFVTTQASGGIVNESKDPDAYVVYTINLKDWFPNGDANNDSLLDSGDYDADPNNWNTPGSVNGAGFEPGSVFTGKFLIPVLKVDSKSTLQLQSYDTKTGKVLRYWNINLASTDPQIDPEKAHTTYYDAENSQWVRPNSPGESNDEQANSYSLVRNHLYTIGAKATDDYDPGTDDPEDLSKGQNLILRVNDNWEVIHRLVVD